VSSQAYARPAKSRKGRQMLPKASPGQANRTEKGGVPTVFCRPDGCAPPQARWRAEVSHLRSPNRGSHPSVLRSGLPQCCARATYRAGSRSTYGRIADRCSVGNRPAGRLWLPCPGGAKRFRAARACDIRRIERNPSVHRVDPLRLMKTQRFAWRASYASPASIQSLTSPLRPSHGMAAPLRAFRLRLKPLRGAAIPCDPSSNSERPPIHSSRVYCKINRPRFPVILSRGHSIG